MIDYNRVIEDSRALAKKRDIQLGLAYEVPKYLDVVIKILVEAVNSEITRITQPD